MVYNVHTFSHLARIRRLGKLSKTSAFRFEGAYSAMLASTDSRAESNRKQVIYSVASRSRAGHSHGKKLTFYEETPALRTNDSLLYYQVLFPLKVTILKSLIQKVCFVPGRISESHQSFSRQPCQVCEATYRSLQVTKLILSGVD